MKHQNWIKSPVNVEGAALAFKKGFSEARSIAKATLRVSSLGIYRAAINGKKVGSQVLTPGLTSYDHRVQYQTYDVTDMLSKDNVIEISVAPGWAVGYYGLKTSKNLWGDTIEAVAELEIILYDGSTEYIITDESWQVFTTEVTHADIYHGETVDMTAEKKCLGNAVSAKAFPLIPQEGADIIENEILSPEALIITPKGERVIDFGQNMTGYVSLKIKGNRGERISLSFGEVLDKDGNFYNANYRSATEPVIFVLSGETDIFKPAFSFQGFRYVRLDEYPSENVDLGGFRAIVVHSKMERTARFACGNDRINQLYHNIIWGQKGNYLDIPTDCPQRDERLGWTGDAQVFCRTAAINFDVRRFFKKWLGDMRAEQREDGAIAGVCPERFSHGYKTRISAGWGDVATIVPWTLYEIYGDVSFLSDNFEMMKRWVGYIRSTGDEEYLWLTGYHYGDWLAMDAGEDSYVGATSNDLIATAFYAYSTELVVKAGEVLGEDVSEYRELYTNIVKRFREYFMENGMPKDEFPLTEILPEGKKSSADSVRRGVTQTAITLILRFNLCLPEERKALVDKLCELIKEFDGRMATGFLGAPYVLHALSDCGRHDVSYDLFFQNKNPSWLYSVDHGATTVWEHWNGIKDDGSFWSTDMNSFNHYAYGSVAEWMYETICGVKQTEVGYKKIALAPVPDKRLGFAKCAIETVSGRIESHWYYKEDRIAFEFTVPEGVEAEVTLPNGYTERIGGGCYTYAVML
ncbi:MAG: family 78 glycoside hydrolase catalytic domain [Clostridia bacterium]|nr:family 78 glycoside hydrolase catalytic domain [Clostridia bacterium]